MTDLEGSTIREDTAARHAKKYSSKNPVQVLVLDRFFRAVAKEVDAIHPETVLDFGCGEGFFLQQLQTRGTRFRSLIGIDLRAKALAEAAKRCPSYAFEQVDLLRWTRQEASFDLVIASEILEHLTDPGLYLEQLSYFCRGHLLLTVPLEPWFQLMNLLRGRDIPRFGNHPEHVNRWGLRSFKRFVAQHVEIERAYTVFPFTIVIARPRRD